VGGLGTKALTCTTSGSSANVIGSFSSCTYLRPRFAIFDADSSPAAKLLSAANPLVRYLATGYLEDILTFFDPVVGEDGCKVGSLELLSSHLLAGKYVCMYIVYSIYSIQCI
jgi:hypothetical protein